MTSVSRSCDSNLTCPWFLLTNFSMQSVSISRPQMHASTSVILVWGWFLTQSLSALNSHSPEFLTEDCLKNSYHSNLAFCQNSWDLHGFGSSELAYQDWYLRTNLSHLGPRIASMNLQWQWLLHFSQNPVMHLLFSHWKLRVKAYPFDANPHRFLLQLTSPTCSDP